MGGLQGSSSGHTGHGTAGNFESPARGGAKPSESRNNDDEPVVPGRQKVFLEG
jgi:hypothetical protein